MKIALRILLLIALGFTAHVALGAESKAAAKPDRLADALRAADDERIAATIAADRSRLEAIYSDELHYAHSNGRVDTKASQIQGIVAGGNRYVGFEYKERVFTPVAPDVALMKGRMLMHLANKTSGQKTTMDLSFLAVWREENGRWRFLAWQSCRIAPPDGKK